MNSIFTISDVASEAATGLTLQQWRAPDKSLESKKYMQVSTRWRCRASTTSEANKQDVKVENVFKMALHYPKYTRADFEAMSEWQLDCLLQQYGLHIGGAGSLHQKKVLAIANFLWEY